jgi:hypothetical protein
MIPTSSPPCSMIRPLASPPTLLLTRPPTSSRASKRVTSAPSCMASHPAMSPAYPPPTTATRFDCSGAPSAGLCSPRARSTPAWTMRVRSGPGSRCPKRWCSLA